MTDPAPRITYKNLMEETGLGRELVKAGIRCGELPGYVVGSRYVIPAKAFEDFQHGRWVPNPRRLFPEPIKSQEPVALVQRREKAS